MKFPRRVFGLPLHPFLVHVPVAFFLTTPILDVAALYASLEPWWTLSVYATAVGLVVGWAAIVTGTLEYLEPSVVGVDIRLAARHGVRTTLAWFAFTAKMLVAMIVFPVTTGLIVVCLALDLLGSVLLLNGIYFGVRQVYDQLGDDE